MQTKGNGEKHMFLKMWLRAGIPILAVTAVVMYFCLYLFLISAEIIIGGRTLEHTCAEMGLVLSNTDLTDRAAVEEQLDRLPGLHMVGILFDGDGREIARSDVDRCADAEGEFVAQYHKMEEALLEIHAGNDSVRNSQVNAFDYNHWYSQEPVWAPQGEYSLYCAKMTAIWRQRSGDFIPVGAGIFAAMTVLTLVIARSYHKLYKRRQAMECAFSQRINALAHDLKTPMMVISGYSENFLAEIQVEKREHYAEKILENVNKMNAVVEEMLEFTRKKQTEQDRPKDKKTTQSA